MVEATTEPREYDFVLDIAHYGGEEAAKLLRRELTISEGESKDLPRVVPGSIKSSFDSDWEDQHESFSGVFQEHFPNGYIARSNNRCLVDANPDLEVDEVLYFTRFTMHLECVSEYFWAEESDDEDFYQDVILGVWERLDFHFGTTQIAFAFVRLLDEL